MADIVLATLNARYAHTGFGLRCLFANLRDLQPRTVLLEFDLQTRPLEIVESLLQPEPRIVGLGVYIWNARESLEVVQLLKQLRPDLLLVLGGPEVSHESEGQAIVHLADYVITGEADLAFAELCQQLLAGERPLQKVLRAPIPDLAVLASPYDAYTDRDLAERTVYLEASRGCPFTCEFCLSSLDASVRPFPLEPFLAAMSRLLDRGLRQFKFVDRTFNLNLRTATRILEFFLERLPPGLFLHFEMVPDRFPDELRDLVKRFPPGSLQLEVGIQTFNPEVADRIHRRQDYARTEENLRFLRRETSAHVHADLIVGLPGESLESFAAGFDRLLRLQPQEIQVGILKRLRGTSLSRHDREWDMIYRPAAPYDLLCNRLLDFPTLQRLRRFARAWDLVANSGNFSASLPLLWTPGTSAFHGFLHWTDWLHREAGRLHTIALDRLAGFLHRYLTTSLRLPAATVQSRLQEDYHRTGRGELPGSVWAIPSPLVALDRPRRRTRQQRHTPASAALSIPAPPTGPASSTPSP